MTIVLVILIFGFFIFSHEMGHYLTARLFHVEIYEFAIGMGPKIFSKVSKKTGIRYSLRLLPIGGFVSMAGEDEESESENSLSSKPVWQRMIVTSAGGVINFITGIIIMLFVVLSTQYLGSTVVANFTTENSALEEAGIEINDKIVKVGTTSVHTSYSLFYEIMIQGCDEVDITVERNGETITYSGVKFPTYVENGITYGDADFQVYGIEKNVGNVIYYTFSQSFTSVKMIWRSFVDLIRGKYGMESVSGPVGTTEVMVEAAKTSYTSLLAMSSVIAINLGMFNLFPLPALDGGRNFMLLIELITKKAVPKKIEAIINAAGLVVLLGLMLVITCKDIIGLFN